MATPASVHLGPPQRSPIWRVLEAVVAIAILVGAGIVHFASYFGIAFVPVWSGWFWVLFGTGCALIVLVRERNRAEWEPPLPRDKVPTRAFFKGLPTWVAWASLAIAVYCTALIAVHVKLGGTRCVSTDGGYALVGGGFTERASNATCEAHEAKRSILWTGWFLGVAFVYATSLLKHSRADGSDLAFNQAKSDVASS